MSLCRKCDRCGGYYDPIDADTKPYGWIEELKVTDGNHASEQMIMWRRSRMDLCHKCLEDFEHFMEGTPLATDILKEENQWSKPAETPKEMEEELQREARSNLKSMKELDTKQVNAWLESVYGAQNSHKEHGL